MPLAIKPDGTYRFVAPGYKGTKEGLGGATMDFIRLDEVGLFIDDEGMLNGQPLNVPVSMFTGICVYGPVVLVAPDPDDEGDSLPASEDVVLAASACADQWRQVVEHAASLGQDLTLKANEATIPPPIIVFIDPDTGRPATKCRHCGDPIQLWDDTTWVHDGRIKTHDAQP